MKKYLLAFFLLALFPTDSKALTCVDGYEYDGWNRHCAISKNTPIPPPVFPKCSSADGIFRYYSLKNKRCEECTYQGDLGCYIGWYNDTTEWTYYKTCGSVYGNTCVYCTPEKCTGCASGYSLDAKGTCIQCPYNCVECSDGWTCITCDSGYTLENGSCVEEITCPANCALCSGNGYCNQCKDGYKLSKDKLSCTDDCTSNEKLDGGVCIFSCRSGTNYICYDATCTYGSLKKKSVYFIDANGGIIDDNSYYCCPTNCAECTDWEQCTACNSGYTLKNGFCVQTPTCAAGEYANSAGNCVSCSTITVKASNGYPGSGKCTACMEGGICTNAECYKGFENDPDNPGQCNFISGCEGLTAGAVYYDEASNSCKSCSTISGNAVNGGCMFCSNKNGTPTCDQWACYSGYSVRFTPPAGYDIVCGKSTCMYTSYFNINTGECAACPSGTIGNCSTPSTACIACSDAIKIENGKCVNCEAKSGNGYAPRPTCTEVECDEGYTYDEEEKECLPGATCKYPLKAVADYSGDCVGCCTD